MRASVFGTGHWLPARARVKVGRSAHSGRQPGRQPACMHCMHKNRLNVSDVCVIMHAEFWMASWLAIWRLTVDGPRQRARCTTASSSDGCMKKTQRSTLRKVILKGTTLSFFRVEFSVQTYSAFPTNHVRCAAWYSRDPYRVLACVLVRLSRTQNSPSEPSALDLVN